MKKTSFTSLAACCMALILTLALAACGTPGQAPSGSGTESAPGKSAAGKYATMEDFAASEEIQDQLKNLKASTADSGYSIDITGKDNKLTYIFKFAEGTDTEGLADALSTTLDSQASTFEAVAASLPIAVEVEDPVVVVLYAESNGTEIYSREFAAK